ncbi:MAG: hypothetical protein RBR02_09315 [Desulfuromonadaceae bacterium]|nr:hypothetical protein [Desulfuromonadaceae bacterium]
MKKIYEELFSRNEEVNLSEIISELNSFKLSHKGEQLFLNNIFDSSTVEKFGDEYDIALSFSDTEYNRDYPSIVKAFDFLENNQKEIYAFFEDKKVVLNGDFSFSSEMKEYSQDEIELKNITEVSEIFDEQNEDVDIYSEPNYQKELNDLKSEIEKYQNAITNMFHFSRNYSNFEENKLGFNVKIYGLDNDFSEKEIKEELLKRGLNKDSIDEFVTDEQISKYQQSFLMDSWSFFEETPFADLKFLGSNGRMGGYAIFEYPLSVDFEKDYSDYSFDDFDDEFGAWDDVDVSTANIEAISNFVEKGYKYASAGLDMEDLVSRFIEDGVQTSQEIKDDKKKAEFQASRTYVDVDTPTSEFKMEGETLITYWGGGSGSIEMDTSFFNSEHLAGEDIYKNLNDGQFGVRSIDGASYVNVEQKVHTKRTFDDDGEIREFDNWECVYEGGVEKLTDGKIELENEIEHVDGSGGKLIDGYIADKTTPKTSTDTKLG